MRRKTRTVSCGGVIIGGDGPISIQSMTNTPTADVRSTVQQILKLEDEGCEIVRCTVPDQQSADALAEIKKKIHIPLVADIHFDYRMALATIAAGADKIRINPGNIGGADNVRAVAVAAKERGIPIRVGVNSGSLEKTIIEKYGGVTAEGIVESALDKVRMLEDADFDDIVISIKSSDTVMNLQAHRLLAEKTDRPFHIGLTESGTFRGGLIKSAVGIGALLLDGIGDTLRVSLTGDPVREISAARDILSAAGLGGKKYNLVVCPTCGRTKVGLEKIALETEDRLALLERELTEKGIGLKGMTVAVMGCAVNGPGEASNADIGIACGEGMGILFRKGNQIARVDEEDIADVLINAVREESERRADAHV